MKKAAKQDPLAERPDLDFSKATRSKYSNLLAKGTNIAIIDPALIPFFPDSASVNRALHAFLAINEQVRTASTRTRDRRRPTVSATPEYDPRVSLPSHPVARRTQRAQSTIAKALRQHRPE